MPNSPRRLWSLPVISVLVVSALAAPGGLRAAPQGNRVEARQDVAHVESATTRPNFIVLLVDDWGWTDASCCGSDLYETPNIDRLAASGVRFTDAYASCTVCSPTRAALLTGMYPARLRVTDWITGHVRPRAKMRIPKWTQRLEHKHTTLAEALKARGYKTAHVGKWHLTPRSQELDKVAPYYPEKHGFDFNVAGNQWGMPGSYFWPYKAKKRKGLAQRVGNFPDGGKDGDYLTDRLTDEALALIDKFGKDPFFLYFAYYNVHTPIQGKPEYVKRYKGSVKQDGRHRNATYAAMVQSVDDSVGRILAKLRELGIDDRTVICLTGDNGGLDRQGRPTENAPLRAGKGSAYEGGVRVPGIVRWPGVTPKGKVCSTPIQSIDFYPTILSIAAVEGDEAHNANVDGVDLSPILRDPTADLGRKALFWHYPHYHPGGAQPYGAVRSGKWRLLEFYDAPGKERVELYDLAADLGERKDLAGAQPERTAELRKLLAEWRRTVKAQMPTLNPRYVPRRPKKGARKKGARKKGA